MKKAKPAREGYRVDLKHRQIEGFWFEYTSLKAPVTLEMAEALARGLKRQGETCRVVKVTGREKSPKDFIEVVD